MLSIKAMQMLKKRICLARFIVDQRRMATKATLFKTYQQLVEEVKECKLI